MMTFREHTLNEAIINPVTVMQGARLLSAGLSRAGIELGKLLAPFPIGGIKGAIGGTVIYKVADKYGWTSIIKTQEAGTSFMMDVFGISAKAAAALFEKVVVTVGAITLGMLLLALVPAKNRKKVLNAFKNIKKKTTIKMSDIKVIGKKIKNAKNI